MLITVSDKASLCCSLFNSELGFPKLKHLSALCLQQVLHYFLCYAYSLVKCLITASVYRYVCTSIRFWYNFYCRLQVFFLGILLWWMQQAAIRSFLHRNVPIRLLVQDLNADPSWVLVMRSFSSKNLASKRFCLTDTECVIFQNENIRCLQG